MTIEIGLPDDLESMNAEIAKAPPQHKLILVEHYTKDGNGHEHAARLGLKRSQYFERKKTAEEYISKRI